MIRERPPENERLCSFSGDGSRWVSKGGGSGGDQRKVVTPKTSNECSFWGLRVVRVFVLKQGGSPPCCYWAYTSLKKNEI